MSAASSKQNSNLKNITVVAGNGKEYNLGNPNSIFFRFRILIYRIKRIING